MSQFEKSLFKWAWPFWLFGFLAMWLGMGTADWVEPMFWSMLFAAVIIWPLAISDALRR